MEEKSEDMTFGQWVAIWRQAKGLTITAAADKANWQVSYWHNLESERRIKKNGELPMPTKATVARIAATLEIPESIVMCACGYAPEVIRQSALRVLPRSKDLHLVDMGPIRDLTASLYQIYIQNNACQQAYSLDTHG